MTQYYRIQPDLEHYMRFQLDNFDFLNKLGEEYELSDLGKPIQHAWKPIKGKFYPGVSARALPDVSTWEADMLILNQKAYDYLGELLQPYGELLPVEVESETCYLLNVLARLPESVIDVDKSEYEYFEEEPVGFRTLTFNEKNIPEDQLLFCVQSHFAYNLYCGDQFKNLVNDKGLGGLYFNTTLIDPYFK
ncbi:MAG: hypothetical protein P8Z72_04835 [Gammaproteobacteria bacterium]